MADALLSAAADQIFTLLKEQAVYHVNLVRGAEKEVRKLGKELNTIRNVLDDAENRRFQNKNINTWLWKLRQTSYEMEDILDEWRYALLKLHNGECSPDDDDDAAPPKQKVCSFIPSSSCLCFKKVVARHEIAKKILNVKAQLDEILEEAKKYGFKISEPTAYPLPEFGRDQSTSFINTEEVQGRGRDVDTLVDKLMGNGGSQEESGIQVLSIVGVGGLGKTTLAQLIYNHSRLKGSFDPTIWICVSNPFDQAAIAKGILESIEKGSSQGAEQLDELLKRVRERIEGKKFHLVLDDVWTEDPRDLKKLPSEIGKLNFLQTFIIPDRASIQIPEALGQLTGLRKLIGFKCGSGWSKLGLLKNLNQLGVVRLCIRLDGMDLKGIVEDSREANLSNKKYIESLDLLFEDEMGEEESARMDVIDALKPHPNLRILCIRGYTGSKLPLWIVSPANQLRRVLLCGCDLTSLPSFEKLQCLEELVLYEINALEFVGREFLGITTNTNFVAFPKLKELRFEGWEKWKEWEDITAEEEESPAFQVMPCLTTLEIFGCGLRALPHRLLRKASSLEILDISTSYGLEHYKNKEGTDWKSISLNNPGLQLRGPS